MEKVPFCITCSLLVYMIQNHYKDTIAVARVVIVGAARIDNAEIVAVVVVRAAEPPPQWNTQTSFFKRTFPSRLQKTGICPFHRLFRQSIPGTVPGYGSCMNYPLFAFPSFSLPSLSGCLLLSHPLYFLPVLCSLSTDIFLLSPFLRVFYRSGCFGFSPAVVSRLSGHPAAYSSGI